MTRDALGNDVSGSPEAVEMLDDAVDRSLRHDGGVQEAAAAAVRADPTFAAAHAVLALADPAGAEQSLAQARSEVERGTDYERSLVGFLDLLLTDGMWAAEQAGLAHAAAHPRDLLGVGLAATIVERSTRADVQEAVLGVYEPSRQALGDHPYLLAMIGFVAQEEGRFAEAGEMARRALEAQPNSVTAAHLRAHVHVETADHDAGLAWLDDYREQMDPRGDYVHHLAWHAALHTLALGDVDGTLARLGDMSGPDCDAFRHVVDNGTLLMRCRLCGLLGPEDDPTDGRAGDPPVPWLTEMPSMYVGFHTAVGLAVQRRSDDLRALARRAPSMTMPGAADLLAPLCRALADYVDGRHGVATDALLDLRPSTYRWGGSRAQRDVVDDILVDCAIRAQRDDVATALLVERTQRRANQWDSAALATVRAR
jgi:tetratricopeptide (TPR) repeat protein